MRMSAIALVFVASATLSAQPTLFQRGDLVRIKPAANGSHVVTPPILEVVAVAGDRMRVADATLYVNDVPVKGFSREFLNRVARTPERAPQTVPAGHCFVMGEQRTNQDISEYWGQHSELSLERAR